MKLKQCSALPKYGHEILCPDCGFPRTWLKTTATPNEIKGAKSRQCEYCNNPDTVPSIPNCPKLENGFPCQWAVGKCNHFEDCTRRLSVHYYDKHWKSTGLLEPPAHMAAQGWTTRVMNGLRPKGNEHLHYRFDDDSPLTRFIKACNKPAKELATETGAAPSQNVRDLYSQAKTTPAVVKPYNEDGWTLSYDWVKGRLCLLSCRLNQLPAAKAKMASNLQDLHDQMHYDNSAAGRRRAPFFVKLLVLADVVNLWFAAGAPLLTLLRHKTISVRATAMVAIGQALLAQEERWDQDGMISQTPYLGFLFYREGCNLPHPAAVVVFEFNRVDLNDGLSNLLGWKWLWPADLNERVQGQRGKHVEQAAFTKSLVLLSYMLQVVFELYQLEYSPELVRHFWIIGTVPRFY